MKLDSLAIKKTMAMQGINVATLSKLTGLTRNSISVILKRGTCSIISAGLIAAALQVDLEEIWKEE
mgnify:CR=1 FL=1